MMIKIVLFENNESIVFVGVNCLATMEEINADFIYCQKPITKWPWGDRRAKQWKKDLKFGYVYACSVKEFYESVLEKDGQIGISQLPPILNNESDEMTGEHIRFVARFV